MVTGGFERKRYSERVEQAFDQAFAYERPLTETFRYAHTMQHGTPEECAALRVQTIQEQRQAVQQAAVPQMPPKQRPPLAVAAPVQGIQELRPAADRTAPQVPEQRQVRGPRH